MSMNKTCPISNFTSEEDSDGIDFVYLKILTLTNLFRPYDFLDERFEARVAAK